MKRLRTLPKVIQLVCNRTRIAFHHWDHIIKEKMGQDRLINTHIHRYIHTHEHTPQYVATPYFKSPGAEIANIIFSKPIKRKSQTTLGLESILLTLESELSHVTWFDQGNTSKHDASKAWKVLAHWNLPSWCFWKPVMKGRSQGYLSRY